MLRLWRHLLRAHAGSVRGHGGGQSPLATGGRGGGNGDRRWWLPAQHQWLPGKTTADLPGPAPGQLPVGAGEWRGEIMSQRIPVKELTDSFRGRAVGALADAQLRTNFRVAMDSLMKKRADAFPDEEEREGLRELGNHIKARALSRLPDLLEQLETRLTANGVKVQWAETTEEANRIVHSIIEAKQGSQVVKGKSMVSEEMEMNDYLADRNIECLESDMGRSEEHT